MIRTVVSKLGVGRNAVRLAAVLAIGALAQAATADAAETSAVARTAMEAAFARADLNGDGKLSREEAVHFPEISARFDELDKNRDGFLGFDEFAAGATAAPG